ncbi:MAG: TolC family protein [Bacteroidota bacterium]|nr:TolC family protein [Bacteroidota bacterium]
MRILIITFGALLLWNNTIGQQILSEEDYLKLAKNHPRFHALDLSIEKNRLLERASFNIPNPNLLIENPTGEFYTVGVQQNIEFPAVYFKQRDLARHRTKLAIIHKNLTSQEINYEMRLAYLSAQAAQQNLTIAATIDSLFLLIYETTQRQFESGQVNALIKTNAALEFGEANTHYMQSELALQRALQKLEMYADQPGIIRVESLFVKSYDILGESKRMDESAFNKSPSYDYLTGSIELANREVSLEKSKSWPGITFGYMNQSNKDSRFDSRFNAGLAIPLWIWQYTSSIQAAKKEVDIAQQSLLVQKKEYQMQLQSLLSEAAQYQKVIQYYEKQANQKADESIDMALRFFKAGQNDYVSYLRTFNQSFNIKKQYNDSIVNYNRTILQIQLLMGIL